MVLLDLFCGRWGWSKAFAARGWRIVGVDLVEPPEIPEGCEFFNLDVLEMSADRDQTIYYLNHSAALCSADAIVASSPCEEFSVHGMKHFHPNPKYPENGIRLFNHTRQLCEAAGVPYVMENVRAAQQFVGNAVHHCGPFYLWGNAVPPLLNQGIKKDMRHISKKIAELQGRLQGPLDHMWSTERKVHAAAIPPELANCVADYFERILEKQAVGA